MTMQKKSPDTVFLGPVAIVLPDSICPVCGANKRGEWIDRIQCHRCHWSHDASDPTDDRQIRNARVAGQMWRDLMGEVTP